MREIYLGKRIKPGTRLDEYVMSVFPALPKNALYKAFRKKDIKVGGRWATPETILKPQDVLGIYLPDDLLFGGQPGGGAGFTAVYEDERLLIADKPQGMPVHPDRGGGGATLIELVREYLGAGIGAGAQAGANAGAGAGAGANAGTQAGKPAPYMCHRIDRNTGGLVAIAKDKEALDTLLQAFACGAVQKQYRCIVRGRPDPQEATLRAYIAKDASRGKVTVYAARSGAPDNVFEIVTSYRTISYDAQSDTGKLEVSIMTGRTHQIRAHLASIGHPIIGDGKYCPNAINKQYNARYQMLIAYKLTFPPLPGLGVSGKTIEIPDRLAHPASTPNNA